VSDWKRNLKADPTDWLLEPENPSVRYWMLVDLLDRPADDAEVQEMSVAISRQPLVQELLAKQRPGGHWGDDETKPMTAAGTLGVLGLLYMLGAEPDERTAAGCDSFLRFCQNECGGFSMVKTRRSGRQDEQGCWLCGSVSRTWPLGKRNRPSKWVTLDALRLLRTLACKG
jgi:hypothetical protein